MTYHDSDAAQDLTSPSLGSLDFIEKQMAPIAARKEPRRLYDKSAEAGP
jgi:hypothetical protein